MKVIRNTDSVDIDRHVIGIHIEDKAPLKRIGVFHNHTIGNFN
jgi:hypothetical protein